MGTRRVTDGTWKSEVRERGDSGVGERNEELSRGENRG